jgi:hydrogenase maturation protein HypF
MLPSAPVHHLLFQALASQQSEDVQFPLVLVATSANAQGSPLVIDDEDAGTALRELADLIVTHDRPILARADDSVMSVTDGAPFFIRRARGFVPEPIDLGEDGPTVLATGGHLKATLCVTRGREAFVSQHVGDLGGRETLRFYHETATRLLKMLRVAPDIVACDLHPDYRSTRFAESLGLPLARIQHHAAHVAAVAAEHHLIGQNASPVLGVALDGQGTGDDGTAWGGELILLHNARWRRCGHLLPLALPGGDLAAKEPWRMGVAALAALGRTTEAERFFPNAPFSGRLAAFLDSGVPIPTTSSLGRLFDAAAALLGVCTHQSYEGQAAMQLEALADYATCLPDGYALHNHILDFRPLLEALVTPGMTAGEGAALFHGTLAAGLAAWIGQEADALALSTICLSGGCLANRLLTECLLDALRARGLQPLLPRAVPASDGGLSLGQAAIARASLMPQPGTSST